MGTCIGRCLTKDAKRPYYSHKTMYSHKDDHVEFDFLMENCQSEDKPRSRKSKCIAYLLSLRRKKPVQEVILELTDDSWHKYDGSHNLQLQRPSTSTSGYREVDTHFQPLDARSLLAAKLLQDSALPRARSIVSSTPPSSLDLEWEHEVCLPVQTMHFAPPADDPYDSSTTNGNNGATATGPSSTAWSRISTPDSLEWDPVEAPLSTAGELDAETEQLLSEIERLTSRALRETGDWTS